MSGNPDVYQRAPPTLPPAEGMDTMTVREGGYGQYCPISRAVEVLGERWTLLIVRDLLCGQTRFNDLARGNPGLSRSLLSKRLRRLEQVGVIERLDGRYELTDAGQELRAIVFGMGEWGARWQFGEPRPEELDPELLLWWVHERIDYRQFPDRRIVLAFRFPGIAQRYWIVRDAQGPSLCTHDPGFEVDLLMTAELATAYELWLGRIELATALRSGAIVLEGQPALVRRAGDAFLLSPAAPLVAAANVGR